jgi:dihydroorotase
MYDVILADATLVLPKGIEKADIAIQNGKIAQIGALKNVKAKEHITLTGLHILPGVIDSQVHFRQPGLEHKEDLQTGTASALLGGVTCVLEMPNTHPPTTNPQALQEKCRLAHGKIWTHIGFFLGATPENGSNLSDWVDHFGCIGIKIFMGSSTGNLLIDSKEALQSILSAPISKPIAVHCEDEQRLISRKQDYAHPGDVASHPIWRDVETAFLATRTVVEYAKQFKKRVHILHVTTQEEMIFLAQHKAYATVEVTPQHLTLYAPECYEQLGSLAQMNPPIREKFHLEALWQGIYNGSVDMIGSDHAPHLLSEKAKPYPQSPSGMPGVQTLLPVMLTHVAQGKISLSHMVKLISKAPAERYGLMGKGSIALGKDADLTLVDLKAERILTHQDSASRCGWTPFVGMKIKGWPIGALIDGKMAMYEGQLLDAPKGQILSTN